MEQLKHEHPLDLIDLQPNYPHYEEEYEDEEEDWIMKWDFNCPCNRCGKEINFYHRYYYNCSHHACDYSLHKFCGDLPATLKHTSHYALVNASHRALNHTLTLIQKKIGWLCNICRSIHKRGELSYCCMDCDFDMDVKCAMRNEENPIIYHEMVYHPSHPHPLVIVNSKPILCECDACGKRHMGIFYTCTTCLCLSIHSDCIFLSKKLQTDHTHPLNLSYSFSEEDKRENYSPKCRICARKFYDEHLWIYKCEKCRYYAHLDCATLREEPFMSIFLSAGVGKTKKNFKDDDHQDLVHLPFPDQTCSILQLPLFNERLLTTTFATNEGNLINHISHTHPLYLVHDTQTNDVTSPTMISSSDINSLVCHNPMKKKEVLCDGCIRPIMTRPFYRCTNEAQGCNFALHEWCTRLPLELKNHPAHPEHTLVLHQKLPCDFPFIFYCSICKLRCNGFSYRCMECSYYNIDVSCGFIPEKIAHEAHPNHLLYLGVDPTRENAYCGACSRYISSWRFKISFSCSTCEFSLHHTCALLFPRMMRHKLDKHPMNLRYCLICLLACICWNKVRLIKRRKSN